MTAKAIERRSEIKASMSILNDEKTGEMMGYKVVFTPTSHSEEEHLIEREIFGQQMNAAGEVTLCYFNPTAVARGKHNFENHKRKRGGRPSIEEEAKAAEEKAEREKAIAEAEDHPKANAEQSETIN